MKNETNNQEINILSLLDTIIDHKWKLIAITASLTTAGLAYSLISKPIYSTNALIQIEQNSASTGGSFGELSALFDGNSIATAEIEILKSRLILGETVEKLNLNIEEKEESKVFSKIFSNKNLEKHIENEKKNEDQPYTITKKTKIRAIKDLEESIEISEKGKQTGIIELKIEGNDPEKIAQIINTISEIYLKQNIQRKSAEAEKTLSFISEFIPHIENQMRNAESRYAEFRQENNLLDINIQNKAASDQLINLQKELLILEQRKREIEPLFTESHKTSKTVQKQINAIKENIKILQADSKHLPKAEQELLNITRDVKVSSELYVNLLNSEQQLKLIKEGKIGNVRIIDYAYVPDTPIKPKKSIIILLSLGLGLLLSLLTAIIIKLQNRGIKFSQEIEESIESPVLSTVPKSKAQEKIFKDIFKKLKGNHLLYKENKKDISLESIRSLRTALKFIFIEKNTNILLISGPTPGVGKSFISANLASIFSLEGKRVLLIDADIRKGYLNQYFGIARGPGISDALDNNKPIQSNIINNIDTNLSFLPAGSHSNKDSELPFSHALREEISQLAKIYDYVIVDTAPILAVSDAIQLTTLNGVNILIAKAESTTIPELKESIKRIEQANAEVSGIVLNAINIEKNRYVGNYQYYQYQDYQY